MIAIKYRGRAFGVREEVYGIFVQAHYKFERFGQEEAARRFLGDNGLPRRQARRLLDAELRNTGPFADPTHPRRVR